MLNIRVFFLRILGVIKKIDSLSKDKIKNKNKINLLQIKLKENRK